jgi:uncharacterized protein YhjY with autotransporter beta-barrel domain
VPFVLDQLEGETLSAFTTGRITNAEVFDRMIARRFSATEYERGRPSHLPSFSGLSPLLRPGTPLASFRAAPSGPAVAAPAPDLVHGGSIGAWLVPFAVFGDQNGRRNASDMTTRLYGVSGGVDYRLPEAFLVPHSERVRIGLGLGYTRSSLENDRGGLMTGSGNIIQTALYGGYRSQHLHVGLAGRYAYSDLETQRHIVFQAIDRLASADFTGNEAGAFVELGGHFGDPKRLWLHPLASFQYDHLSQDEFRETGAGDLSLGVNGATWDSMQLTVGARISRVFTLRGEFGLEPEIRGGYIGEFGDTQRPVRSRFWAVPGATPFVTAGAPADESTGWVGMGYVMSVASVPLLSLEYDAYLGEHGRRRRPADQATTPFSRSAAMASSARPSSARISSLCCPGSGAMCECSIGVPRKSTGVAGSSVVPTPSGISTNAPAAWACASAITSSTVWTGAHQRSCSASKIAPHSSRVFVAKISSSAAISSAAFAARSPGVRKRRSSIHSG